MDGGPPREGRHRPALATPPGLVNSVIPTSAGYATVDLANEHFLLIDPADQRAAFAQIVLTLVRRPGIGQVKFTLDGEPIRVQTADGLQTETGELVSLQDYQALLTAPVRRRRRPRPAATTPRRRRRRSARSIEALHPVGAALPVLVDLDPQAEERPLRQLRRARSPTCLSTFPPRPMTIPFWLSRSTMISTVMRSPSHSLTRVAIEYGSSSWVTASSCSRTSSATHWSSGRSRIASSGKYAGPSGSRATRCSTRAASPALSCRHREVGLGTELAGGGELGITCSRLAHGRPC